MSKTINSDLIRGNINTIILKALYSGDRYGYDIIKEIEEKSHGQYILKQPTLYSCLKRLESQGFVSSYWGTQSNGGRRKYYTLTDMGREVFVQSQDEYEYSRTIIDQLISERDYDLDSLERKPNNEETSNDLIIAQTDCAATSFDDDKSTLEEQPILTAEEDIEITDEEPETKFDSTVNNVSEISDNTINDSDLIMLQDEEVNEEQQDEDFGGFDDDEAFLLDDKDEDFEDETATNQSSLSENNEINKTENNESLQQERIEDKHLFDNVSNDNDKQSFYYDGDSSSLIDDLLNSDDEISYSDNLENENPELSDGSGGKNFYSDDLLGNAFYDDQSYAMPREQYGFAYDEDESEINQTVAAAPTHNTSSDLHNDNASSFSENEFMGYHINENSVTETEHTSNNYNKSSNYKNLLSSLIDNFDTESDIKTITQSEQSDIFSETQSETIPEETLSVKEKVQVRNFGKLSQSIRELGEDVKIRTSDNNAVHEFNKQYYYYRNKLLLFQYGILFVIMLLESFITYISIKSSVKAEMSYSIPLYVCSIIFSIAFPITAGLLFLFDPYKRKRIDFNFKSSIIFRVIIMLQLILIIYAANVFAGMPIGGSSEYLLSMILPCILTTNVPLSSVIFNYLYRSKLFSVE